MDNMHKRPSEDHRHSPLPYAKRRQTSAPVTQSPPPEEASVVGSGGNEVSYEGLSTGQRNVVERVMLGKNVFFTGCAGTGKSFVLRRIIELCGSKPGVFVTAMTGAASIQVGGTTLHSFAGVGLATGTVDHLCAGLRKKARDRWLKARILIVDEVSMMSADLFEKVDRVGRYARGEPDKPFGGVQLVFCGDFLQLPPVGGRDAVRNPKLRQFCTTSDIWTDCFEPGCNIELKQVFRQERSEFLDVLGKVRLGVCDEQVMRVLNARVGTALPDADGIEPTRLHCYRRDVDTENDARLDTIKMPAHIYNAYDVGAEPHKGQLKNCMARAQIRLKVGAQVMLLQNQTDGSNLVNGSRGVVIGFRTVNDESKKNRYRINPSLVWPVVRFVGGRTMVVTPGTWTVEEEGCERAKRSQIPLALAWCATIHKSQGMTLDRAVIDLHNIFSCGQAYVALSRLSNIDGLCILRPVKSTAIHADSTALDFYKSIKTTEQDDM